MRFYSWIYIEFESAKIENVFIFVAFYSQFPREFCGFDQYGVEFFLCYSIICLFMENVFLFLEG